MKGRIGFRCWACVSLTRLHCSSGGESASVTFDFALRIFSFPSPEMLDPPLALPGGEHPYMAQEVRPNRK